MKSNWNGMDSDCRLRTECGIVPIVGSLEFGEDRGEIEEGDNLRAAIVTILDHEFFPAKEHYSRDPPVWWPVEVPYSSFYHGREESTVGAPLQEMRVVLGEYKKFIDARRRGVVDGDMAKMRETIRIRTEKLPNDEMKRREKKKEKDIVDARVPGEEDAKGSDSSQKEKEEG
ncbi:hypothetical protein PENTCL1PPCAC_22812 [Pristionchus entomophagus]|uniref:Uncharacterized protein n=1 Tax=Pristionchus entomophagus TaxID=358040 RepID=A0AAV5U2N0_9BILA|nr:hypothetical protein PENTCL1PPCAC_22812 [Pristionchus entomophagus]